MARDKLSKFLWYKLLVKYFFWPTKFARTTNMKIACDPRLRLEVTAVARRQTYKTFGVGHNFPRTTNMPKKSRAAREQPDKLFAILAEQRTNHPTNHLENLYQLVTKNDRMSIRNNEPSYPQSKQELAS